MQIFNHDITLSTHDDEAGTHLFSGRALGLTKPEDKVQIHPELASEWDAIVAHYAQIGLPHTQDIIWDVSITTMDQHPDYEPCVYFFGDAVNQHNAAEPFFLKHNARWCKVVEFANSKNNFIQLAEELGIAIPKTLRFANLAAARACNNLPFPCYVKPAVSDHGCGIKRCADQAALDEAFTHLMPSESLQIQAEVPASAFLNLQYQVTPDGAQPLLATEQILNGCVHAGNRCPAKHQPWDTVQPFADWMALQGMKGIFAVDVAVVPNGDDVQFLAIECNPRYNGSSYPTLIAQRLGISQWSGATYRTEKRSLQDFSLADLTYDPATGKGLILVNWGTIKAGKISVLLAGSEVEQAQFGAELESRLKAPVALLA